MKKITIETKADEIEILRALAAAPSYFADYFTIEIDLPQMIHNIENDFPLLNDTVAVRQAQANENLLKASVTAKAEMLDEKLDALQSALKELSTAENSLAETRESLRREKERAQWFLRDVLRLHEGSESEVNPEKYFGKNEILMAKLHANIHLNKEELNTIDSTLNPPQL